MIERRIDGDNPHGEFFRKNSGAAISLGQQSGRVDHRGFEIIAAHGVSQYRRSGGHAKPRLESLVRAAADSDAHVSWSVVRRVGIAGNVQADLPEHQGSLEIGAAREWFHEKTSRNCCDVPY